MKEIHTLHGNSFKLHKSIQLMQLNATCRSVPTSPSPYFLIWIGVHTNFTIEWHESTAAMVLPIPIAARRLWCLLPGRLCCLEGAHVTNVVVGFSTCLWGLGVFKIWKYFGWLDWTISKVQCNFFKKTTCKKKLTLKKVYCIKNFHLSDFFRKLKVGMLLPLSFDKKYILFSLKHQWCIAFFYDEQDRQRC